MSDTEKPLPQITPSYPDWINLFSSRLACRCAERLNKLASGNMKIYRIFSLENYGECWSSKTKDHNPGQLDVVKSCVGAGYLKCNNDTVNECVGTDSTSYLYQVNQRMEIISTHCQRVTVWVCPSSAAFRNQSLFASTAVQTSRAHNTATTMTHNLTSQTSKGYQPSSSNRTTYPESATSSVQTDSALQSLQTLNTGVSFTLPRNITLAPTQYSGIRYLTSSTVGHILVKSETFLRQTSAKTNSLKTVNTNGFRVSENNVEKTSTATIPRLNLSATFNFIQDSRHKSETMFIDILPTLNTRGFSNSKNTFQTAQSGSQITQENATYQTTSSSSQYTSSSLKDETTSSLSSSKSRHTLLPTNIQINTKITSLTTKQLKNSSKTTELENTTEITTSLKTAQSSTTKPTEHETTHKEETISKNSILNSSQTLTNAETWSDVTFLKTKSVSKTLVVTRPSHTDEIPVTKKLTASEKTSSNQRTPMDINPTSLKSTAQFLFSPQHTTRTSQTVTHLNTVAVSSGLSQSSRLRTAHTNAKSTTTVVSHQSKANTLSGTPSFTGSEVTEKVISVSTQSYTSNVTTSIQSSETNEHQTNQLLGHHQSEARTRHATSGAYSKTMVSHSSQQSSYAQQKSVSHQWKETSHTTKVTTSKVILQPNVIDCGCFDHGPGCKNVALTLEIFVTMTTILVVINMSVFMN